MSGDNEDIVTAEAAAHAALECIVSCLNDYLDHGPEPRDEDLFWGVLYVRIVRQCLQEGDASCS